jgi:hypothetical protein
MSSPEVAELRGQVAVCVHPVYVVSAALVSNVGVGDRPSIQTQAAFSAFMVESQPISVQVVLQAPAE